MNKDLMYYLEGVRKENFPYIPKGEDDMTFPADKSPAEYRAIIGDLVTYIQLLVYDNNTLRANIGKTNGE